MKPARLLSVIVILALGISACQKQLADELPANPPPPQNASPDSIYLNKIYLVNVTAGASDTEDILTYHYDNLKRVTAIEDSTWSVIPADKTPWYSIKYSYNGSDTLPVKSLYLHYEKSVAYNNPSVTDTTITFFYYNAVGQNQSDSTLTVVHDGDGTPLNPFTSNGYKTVQNYQYPAGKIYRKVVVTNLSGTYYGSLPLGEQRDTAVTDANANIQSMKRYFVDNGVSTLDFSSIYTYDNKVNPFYHLSDFRTNSVVPHFEELTDLSQSKNNRLKAIETDASGNTEEDDLTGNYTYRNDDYPLTFIQTYAWAAQTYKYIFTYKSL